MSDFVLLFCSLLGYICVMGGRGGGVAVQQVKYRRCSRACVCCAYLLQNAAAPQ